MAYITQQQFCDMLKVSKKTLRLRLKEHEYPVYEVKRCGRLVYDQRDAIEFVKLIEVERVAAKQRRALNRWRNRR